MQPYIHCDCDGEDCDDDGDDDDDGGIFLYAGFYSVEGVQSNGPSQLMLKLANTTPLHICNGASACGHKTNLKVRQYVVPRCQSAASLPQPPLASPVYEQGLLVTLIPTQPLQLPWIPCVEDWVVHVVDVVDVDVTT